MRAFSYLQLVQKLQLALRHAFATSARTTTEYGTLFANVSHAHWPLQVLIFFFDKKNYRNGYKGILNIHETMPYFSDIEVENNTSLIRGHTYGCEYNVHEGGVSLFH